MALPVTRVMLVQGSGTAGEVVALGAGGLAGKVTVLAHPRTGEMCRWMITGDDGVGGTQPTFDILELQVAKVASRAFNSFFIDQSVQSEGSLYIATRIDPMLLLLPLMEKRKAKWTRLEESLQEEGMGWLLRCKHVKADTICDVNDQLGPDLLLYKLNEDKVMEWLQSKVTRVLTCLEKFSAGKASGSSFASGFSGALQSSNPVADEANATESEETATTHSEESTNGGSNSKIKVTCIRNLSTALELVCEYLPPEWSERISEKHGVVSASLYEPKVGKKKAPVPTLWEVSAEEDRNLSLSLGKGKASAGTGGASNSTKKATPAAAKSKGKLANVNTKGMKSMSSFFSSAPAPAAKKAKK